MTQSKMVNPIPDAYRRVTPCLVVDGGARAIEFYTDVFQATERYRFPGPGDTVAHAEIEIGDSVIIIEDPSPERGTQPPPSGGLPGTPTFHFIYVEDADKVVEQAVKLGAHLQRPPENQFYGDRDGFIIDPFGHGWVVATHIEDVEPGEMMRRMSEPSPEGP
jgi:PhnB protein